VTVFEAAWNERDFGMANKSCGGRDLGITRCPPRKSLSQTHKPKHWNK
jgi:hypothetical protein